MKYRVIARDWDNSLKVRFGDYGSVCELTDEEVIAAIIRYGRAEITLANGFRELYFLNDDD